MWVDNCPLCRHQHVPALRQFPRLPAQKLCQPMHCWPEPSNQTQDVMILPHSGESGRYQRGGMCKERWSRWLNLTNLSGRPCVCEWSMTALATHSRTRQVNGEHSASAPVGKEGLLGCLLLFSGLVTDKLTAHTRMLPEWRCQGCLGLHLFWDLELSGRLGYHLREHSSQGQRCCWLSFPGMASSSLFLTSHFCCMEARGVPKMLSVMINMSKMSSFLSERFLRLTNLALLLSVMVD